MGAAGVETQLAVSGVAVGGIGYHGAAVGRGATGEEKIGAGLAGLGLPAQDKEQQGCGEDSFHDVYVDDMLVCICRTKSGVRACARCVRVCKDTLFF